MTNSANHGLLDAALVLWIFDAPNLLTLVPSLADEAEIPQPRSPAPDDAPLNKFLGATLDLEHTLGWPGTGEGQNHYSNT